MAKLEPPQIHEQFNIREQNDFKGDISQKEKMIFKRDSVRHGFGYVVISAALYIIYQILFYLPLFQREAWTLFVIIVTAAVTYIFGTSDSRRND